MNKFKNFSLGDFIFDNFLWIMAVVILGLFGVCWDYVQNLTVTDEIKGKVVGKQFDPEKSTTFTGIGTNGKVFVGSGYSSAKYNFHVQYGDIVIEVKSNIDNYYKSKIGDSVTVQIMESRVFGFQQMQIK